jgi:hypothetical protein
MRDADHPDRLPLPKGWPAVARRAILHALSLSAAAFNLDLARWLENPMPEARERTEARRVRAEIELLTEELRVKDARSAATDPHRRAHYSSGPLPDTLGPDIPVQGAPPRADRCTLSARSLLLPYIALGPSSERIGGVEHHYNAKATVMIRNPTK